MNYNATLISVCSFHTVIQKRQYVFNAFETDLPPKVLYFLSGLTCTDENFATKAGGFGYAARHKIAIVMPDTSPRGDDIPKGDSWDFGQGAGFYVDATQEPYKKNYRMYSYITQELPSILERNFHEKLDFSRQSIFGHSMGGKIIKFC
jgi:S-formylglutathione hydrolase